ncbi:MAG: aminotransferase class V-fold PLP-dependent enzyme, partial [Pseudomonadota bacterium]
MQSRRSFLQSMSLPAVAAATFHSTELNALALDIASELSTHTSSARDTAGDEAFWFQVQRAFTVDRTLLNLNNGGVSPAPGLVQEAMKRHQDYSNLAPTYTMWQILEPQREAVRQRMAQQWGVDTEEVAFTRNASESLQIMQLGIDLEPGDEVLTTTQDYGRMITTFEQRVRREGIVLKQIKLPVPAEDPAEVVRLFEDAITPNTKMILACHMINLTGQILPVSELTAMARRRGIPLVIDGAHALAHFDFDLGGMDVDNYSTSLHKWLFAPHGTGMLYVRRDKIADVWPLMAAPEQKDSDIRKFEEIGTHPEAPYLAIGEALSFHQGIGPARKAARLVYLRDHWANRVLDNPRVRLNTSQ